MSDFPIKPPGQNTDRNFSPSLWKDCELDVLRKNPGWGSVFERDFLTLPTGEWTTTQATSGTMALTDAQGGQVQLNSGATTDNQGIQAQLGGTNGETILAAAGVTIWFEAIFKLTASGTGPQLFMGLAETDTTIIASGAMSGTNYIGFQSVTDNNVILLNGTKASAAATVATGTLTDATWYKLGFKVTGVTKVEQWLNGNQLAAAFALATANIPIVETRLSLVCQANGTTQPVLWIDHLRLAIDFRNRLLN